MMRYGSHPIIAVIFFVLSLLVGLPSSGQSSAALATCDGAAHHAAIEHGVPLSLLRAIALVESGQGTQDGRTAWPWTANIDGESFYFATRNLALAHTSNSISNGAQQVDIGCFQINVRWHSENFASIQSMFDPITNANYAASFLAELYVEFGNWDDAVAAFHNRDPSLGQPYRLLVVAELERLTAEPGEPVVTELPERLVTERPSSSALGSLAAFESAAGPLITGLYR